jgi:hypothetical protein
MFGAAQSYSAGPPSLRESSSTSLSPPSLHSILLHQTFTGSFPFATALLSALSVSIESFDKGNIELNKIIQNYEITKSVDMLTTGVVVIFLESKMTNEKHSWELVVEKARQWLEENCGGVERAEIVLATARKIVG